jgi:endo-1,4-beta-D-glucanase Y
MSLQERLWLAPALVLLSAGMLAQTPKAPQKAAAASTSGPAAKTAEWPLWERYASRFVDEQGRVIDRQAADRSTSESQTYGLFFALVANDRPRFDKILLWTTNNLAAGDLTKHLPAWRWGKDKDNNWHVLDPNPASDADLWLSYTLLEAARLWREPKYKSLGLSVLNQVAQQEVVLLSGFGPMLVPAPLGFHPDKDIWILNPSYLPVPLLSAASKAQPSGPWKSIAHGLPSLVCQGSGKGFAMDWISYKTGEGFAPAVAPGPAPTAASGAAQGVVPTGSYDAIRVYLWAGLSQDSSPSSRKVLGCIQGMADYLEDHPEPPEVVDAKGTILKEKGSIGFSAAVLPYLDKLHRHKALLAQQQRLAQHLNEALGLYGEDPYYYDQNLALFAQGWQEHRYRFDQDGSLRVGWKR